MSSPVTCHGVLRRPFESYAIRNDIVRPYEVSKKVFAHQVTSDTTTKEKNPQGNPVRSQISKEMILLAAARGLNYSKESFQIQAYPVYGKKKKKNTAVLY